MPTIFISYSRKDEVWLQKLQTFLIGLFQKDDVWSDERIAAGEDWREKIESAIQDASVAILLISQDFLA
jgi:TIR domain-containing protein